MTTPFLVHQTDNRHLAKGQSVKSFVREFSPSHSTMAMYNEMVMGVKDLVLDKSLKNTNEWVQF